MRKFGKLANRTFEQKIEILTVLFLDLQKCAVPLPGAPPITVTKQVFVSDKLKGDLKQVKRQKRHRYHSELVVKK